MEKYGLRLPQADLFGKEAGQELTWKKEKTHFYDSDLQPGEMSVHEAEKEFMAPMLAGQVEAHKMEVRRHAGGINRAYPDAVKAKVVAEVLAALKVCRHGQREATVKKVAQRHGLHYSTIMVWVRKANR